MLTDNRPQCTDVHRLRPALFERRLDVQHIPLLNLIFMNVHRKPISEMSTICRETRQNARGSPSRVERLVVGSGTTGDFCLHVHFSGHGTCYSFSDDITQNRMEVYSLSYQSQKHTRFVPDRGYPYLSPALLLDKLRMPPGKLRSTLRTPRA